MAGPPVVAVINTSDDLIELLKVNIEAAGFLVMTIHISEIRTATFDVDTWLKVHDPRVVVYDVAPPFDKSWRFLAHLRNSPAFAGRHFVLTSPNAARVHEVVKTDETVYEVIGEEGDIHQIVQAVREAAHFAQICRRSVRTISPSLEFPLNPHVGGDAPLTRPRHGSRPSQLLIELYLTEYVIYLPLAPR
jgi:hypothetical protein